MSGRVLITGASGFIGGHLVSRALNQGMEVYAAVRASSKTQHLMDHRIRLFPFDMGQPEQIHMALRKLYAETGGFQYVIHNAAINAILETEEFISGNAEFSREFARMIMETQTGLKKFIFMSSMAAIGPGNPESMDLIDERHPRRPVTPYGHSKLLAERYIHEIEGLPYVIVRPTGVYGPGDTKFSLKMIAMLKKGIEVQLGPPDHQVSFVHVEDVARVSIDACVSKIAREDFNISDGRFYSQKDFNVHLKKALGVRTLPVRIPSRVAIAAGYAMFRIGKLTKSPVRLSHQKMEELTARNWRVDITKAKTLLGFEPVYDLEQGLKHVVDTM